MTTFLIVLAAIFGNFLVGAAVWAAIDAKDKRFYIWYISCPPEIAFWAQPLTLFLWPVGLWMWWKEKND